MEQYRRDLVSNRANTSAPRDLDSVGFLSATFVTSERSITAPLFPLVVTWERSVDGGRATIAIWACVHFICEIWTTFRLIFYSRFTQRKHYYPLQAMESEAYIR